MKLILLLIAVLGLSGCGNTSKTYETVENNITVDEPYPIEDGFAIIVDSSNNAEITVENDTILIECSGSCGNINIGMEAQ